MKNETYKFIVSVPKTDLLTEAIVHDYIVDAVTSWCGGLRPPYNEGYEDNDPGDPMWSMGQHITVKRFKSP